MAEKQKQKQNKTGKARGEGKKRGRQESSSRGRQEDYANLFSNKGGLVLDEIVGTLDNLLTFATETLTPLKLPATQREKVMTIIHNSSQMLILTSYLWVYTLIHDIVRSFTPPKQETTKKSAFADVHTPNE